MAKAIKSRKLEIEKVGSDDAVAFVRYVVQEASDETLVKSGEFYYTAIEPSGIPQTEEDVTELFTAIDTKINDLEGIS